MTDDDEKELAEMSRRASKKLGRPIKWTDEAIDAFADELLEWAKKPDSLVLVSFALDKDLSADIMARLEHLSPRFSKALRDAKRILGARRETGALTKVYESKVYDKSQRMYDPDWTKCQEETLAREELIKAEAKIKALQKQLKIEKEQGENSLLVKIINYAEKN